MSKSWGEIQEEALRRCGQLPPKTNADRIRAMSDEELAEFLNDTQGRAFRGMMLLHMQWLDWLKQEVVNDG